MLFSVKNFLHFFNFCYICPKTYRNFLLVDKNIIKRRRKPQRFLNGKSGEISRRLALIDGLR